MAPSRDLGHLTNSLDVKGSSTSKEAGEDKVIYEAPKARMRAGWEAFSNVDDEDAHAQTGILKCLNIPYADIPYRWAAPRPVPLSWPGTRDCTAFGPGCPQTGSPLFDVSGIPLFGHPGPASLSVRADTEDEFKCLNLNVFVPARKGASGRITVSRQPLPVLVWVHGGSYQVGSASVDVYDGSNLVRRSVEVDMPLIVVTFNYRLGIFGFFHSKELADEASRQNEVPLQFRSTGNLGLVDAHYAFDWVKENIARFGGDPENITAIGESAGAGTINYLVLTPQLQIHIPRIILSSSTCASIQLLRPSQAQSWFDAVCEKLHIDPRSDRSVAQLRDVATEKLIEESSFALSSFRPIWDDITITADAREVFSNPYVWDPSLKEVILGVCQNEPWIRQAALLDQKSELPRLIKGRIPPSPPELRNRAYELYAEDCLFPWFKVPPGVPRFHQSALAFEGHMRYYSPAQLFSDSFIRSEKGGRAIFRYVLSWVSAHFPPTWPVTHTADILLTFLHKSLAAAEVPVALSFVDQLIAFSTGNRGKMLWKGYTSSQRCLNELDENGTWQVLEDRNGAFDLMDEYSEFCSQVMNASVKAGREGWSEMIR